MQPGKCRVADRGGREKAEKERKKADQLGAEQAEVGASGGQDDVSGVAGGAAEDIAA